MLRNRSARRPVPGEAGSVIAIEIGTLVGRGRTAEIYAVGDDRVLKLLLPEINPLVLEREAAYTAAAHDAGAPAPAVFGPMTHGGRPGMVFERVRGPALARALVTKPWRLGKYARLMADVHFDLHTRRSAALPDLRERLAAKIDASDGLPPGLQRIAKDELVALDSSGDHVLHGDLHADNVLLSPRGPMVIDWLDASRGVPAADVARSQWLSSAAVLPPRMPFRAAAVAVLTRFGSEYLRHYLARSGMDARLVRRWRLPVLAARLSEEIEHEMQPLVAEVRRLASDR